MKKAGVISSGKFKLPYVIEGQGTPILIIGSSKYYPRTFSKNFKKNFKCIFMDHRGFAPHPGKVNSSEFDLDILLDDIELVRKAVGVDKCYILGHSGHGYLALEYAKKYPQHVKGVILIGVGPDQSDESNKAAEEYFEQLASSERKKDFAENMKYLAHDIAAHPERRMVDYLLRAKAKGWYDFTFDASPLWKDVTVNMQMFDHAWGGIFKTIDITKGLDKFNIPIFLGLGKYDFIVAPPSSWDKLLPLFKNITVYTFEKSGHTPQFEESELFDRKMTEWIEKIEKQSN
jgi:proline iminopeptidase